MKLDRRLVIHIKSILSLPVYLAKSVVVLSQVFRSQPLVLVYQMGKVGSSSVYETIKTKKRDWLVYHVHFLAPDNLVEVGRYHWQTGNLKALFSLVKNFAIYFLSRYLIKHNRPVYIVSLVREPVARDISDIFQNQRIHQDIFSGNDEEEIQYKIERKVLEMFAGYDYAKDHACTWYDKELKAAFGIDVFSIKFDTEAGYQIIERNGVDLLLLRLEDLEDNLVFALNKMFGCDCFGCSDVRNANLSESKSSAQLYKKVRNNTRLSMSVLDHIYSSRYFVHFYGKDGARKFIGKWLE